jgi:hypothetical protein
LTACGGSGNNNGKSGEASSSSSTGGNAINYKKYLEQPCQLLTEDIVRKHVDNITGQLDQKEHVDKKSSDMYDIRKCQYNWEKPEKTVEKIEADFEQVAERLDDRTQAILIKQQQPAVLRGSRVVLTDLHVYENKTPEEAKESFKKYDEGWRDPKKKEKERKERLKERFEDGKLTKAQYERERKKIEGFGWKPVEGVGDMAYWNSNYRAEHLQVLSGTLRFNLEAQVYYDAPEKNKEVAKKIAKEIVKKLQ